MVSYFAALEAEQEMAMKKLHDFDRDGITDTDKDPPPPWPQSDAAPDIGVDAQIELARRTAQPLAQSDAEPRHDRLSALEQRVSVLEHRMDGKWIGATS